MRPKDNTRESMVLETLANIGVHRFSALQFLLSLVLLLITAPFVQEMQNGDLILAILGIVVLSSAILVVGGRRPTRIAAFILVTPVIAARVVQHYWPGLLPPGTVSGTSFVFVAFVTVYLLRYVLIAPRINSDVLYAGLSGYMLLALLWGLAYALVDQWSPGSVRVPATSAPQQTLESFDALYFSFITLNTVGYGDIVPVTKTTKMLTMLQSTTGLFYMTVLVARLVSLYTAEQFYAEKNAKR